jgi:hypothetical protein
LAERRRSSILSLNDSEHAAQQECRNDRQKKERTISFSHGIDSHTRKMTQFLIVEE